MSNGVRARERIGADRPRRRKRKGRSVRLAVRSAVRELRSRLLQAVVADDGMSTVEYAIGTIAAAAFGAVLYTVVTGDSIVNALTRIIDKALNTSV
jgi:hypothetical protein